MKKLLILSAFILLGGVLSADAQTITSWPITVYTGATGSGVYTTPLATLQVTRTHPASSTWDSLDIKLSNWLLPSYQAPLGEHSVGSEINLICGTFTAVNSTSTPGMLLSGTTAQFPGRTTWNYGEGTPTYTPNSYINLENTLGTFTRGGTDPNYTSLFGYWYANATAPGATNATDLTASDYNLTDGKDQTLIAKFFVTAGTDISFVADPSDAVQGVNSSLGGLAYWSFSTAQVPEPGTIALLVSGLMGLLCYARRKRK